MRILDNMPVTIRQTLMDMGGITSFTLQFSKDFFKPPFEAREILNQCYQLGYRSLFLVSIAGFIIGMVMTLQLRPTMLRFGSEALLPSMVSIAIIREIGPVLTALICAGKIASGIGAVLGSMRVTEQIDAMTISGANAFNYLVVTRVIATTLTVPLLVFYADAIALAGSFIAVNLNMNLNLTLFLSDAVGALTFQDVVPATIKTFFFGFAVGIVGCYQGYNAKRGTTGVGEAANSAVVVASLFIFIIDLFTVQITQLFVG
ncbi:MAG: ABC transporter permease [Cyclobacteriaceae bacterium]|nr:ABC transporter permease [Cyclobacteriaceae bacterium]